MEREPLQVHEYLGLINDTIEPHAECMIEGEVSEFRISQGKWVSFSMKDEHEEAILPCFMTTFQLKIPLEDGMKVVVKGQPRIYPRFGKFSLNVRQIEVAGEGSLKRAFELTKKKLADEGIFDEARKRSLPEYPQHIGIITSTEAAAYTDFTKIITARFPGVELSVIPVHVQGRESIADILGAFEYFNTNYEKLGVEAVVLTRGGGGLEDLHAFNSEEVARAVFRSRLPVICAVGHERDESLADYAADVRASTPSNAAELLVRHQSDVFQDISYAEQRITDSVSTTITEYNRALERFVSHGDLLIKQHAQQISFSVQMITGKIQGFAEQSGKDIENAIKYLDSLNPSHVLKRGYSIAKTKDGAVLTLTKQAPSGTQIDLEVSDGTIETSVL